MVQMGLGALSSWRGEASVCVIDVIDDVTVRSESMGDRGHSTCRLHTKLTKRKKKDQCQIKINAMTNLEGIEAGANQRCKLGWADLGYLGLPVELYLALCQPYRFRVATACERKLRQ